MHRAGRAMSFTAIAVQTPPRGQHRWRGRARDCWAANGGRYRYWPGHSSPGDRSREWMRPGMSAARIVPSSAGSTARDAVVTRRAWLAAAWSSSRMLPAVRYGQASRNDALIRIHPLPGCWVPPRQGPWGGRVHRGLAALILACAFAAARERGNDVPRAPAQRQLPRDSACGARPGYRGQASASRHETRDGYRVALQRGKVVFIERAVHPLNRTGVVDLPGDGCVVGADEVDLRIEGAVPPAADRDGPWPGKIIRRKRQGLADHRFDRPPAPAPR